MLIGQTGLKSRLIDLLNQDNLPNTIILVGPEGQGKRSTASWLADQMEAPIYTLPDLKVDSIREMNLDSRTIASPKLYLLADAEGLTPQAQNALLKLSEEPPENAYIVMTVKDTSSLLQTILSRSITFRLDGYSLDELSEFTDNDELKSLAANPGTILRLQSIDYEQMLQHARKVVSNIGLISAANAFNILKSIDKANYDLFMSMLIHAYGELVADGVQSAKQLEVLYETKGLLEQSKSINKQNALEMMFVKLREAARSEVQ